MIDIDLIVTELQVLDSVMSIGLHIYYSTPKSLKICT